MAKGIDYPHFGKVIFIFAAMLFISCSLLGSCRRPAEENFCGCTRMEGFSNSKPIFYFFGVNWCGYCKQAKPEWDKFVARAQGEELNVLPTHIDAEADPELAAEYGVRSYPTFVLVKDGERIPFEGPRTVDNFVAFVQKNAA